MTISTCVNELLPRYWPIRYLYYQLTEQVYLIECLIFVYVFFFFTLAVQKALQNVSHPTNVGKSALHGTGLPLVATQCLAQGHFSMQSG